MRGNFRKRKSKIKLSDLTYNPDLWVTNTTEVKKKRDELKTLQGGLCAVLGEQLERSCLDHAHLDSEMCGEIRGVLSSRVNLIEGRYRALYRKQIKYHTKMSFPCFLIRLGEYLSQGSEQERMLHYKIIEEKASKLHKEPTDTIREACQELVNSLESKQQEIT